MNNTPKLALLDSDIKMACAEYMQHAEASGADGSQTVAEMMSVLIALASQLSSVVMTKEGFLSVSAFAFDKHVNNPQHPIH